MKETLKYWPCVFHLHHQSTHQPPSSSNFKSREKRAVHKDVLIIPRAKTTRKKELPEPRRYRHAGYPTGLWSCFCETVTLLLCWHRFHPELDFIFVLILFSFSSSFYNENNRVKFCWICYAIFHIKSFQSSNTSNMYPKKLHDGAGLHWSRNWFHTKHLPWSNNAYRGRKGLSGDN